MEKYVFTSHSYCVKEDPWAHIIPLYTKKLLSVIIEFRVVPHHRVNVIVDSFNI